MIERRYWAEGHRQVVLESLSGQACDIILHIPMDKKSMSQIYEVVKLKVIPILCKIQICEFSEIYGTIEKSLEDILWEGNNDPSQER